MLRRAGHDPIIYNADEVFAGRKLLTYTFDSRAARPVVRYDGQELSPETVGAAWYWRPNGFFAEPPKDKGRMMTLGRELFSLQSGIFQAAIPEGAWLNNPHRMHRANDKLWQLEVARSVGFTIPTTAVSNTWAAVTTLSPPIIMKMVIGQVFNGDQSKLLYTTLLDSQKMTAVKDVSPFPGIFQQYVKKAREWRITMVAGRAFPVAIYTTESAKADWRRPTLPEGAVRYVHEPADPAVIQKCREYMRKTGLRYGAFDLIESPDGAIAFLEMNTNGQFRGFEIKTEGLTISQAIAQKLIALAAR